MRSPPRIRVGAAFLLSRSASLPYASRSEYGGLVCGNLADAPTPPGLLGYRNDMSTSCAAFALLATLPSLSVAGPAPCTPSSGVYSLSLLSFCWLASARRNGGAKTTRSRASRCRLRTARTRRAHRRHLPRLRASPSTRILHRFSLRRPRIGRASPSGAPSVTPSSTCRIRSLRVPHRVPSRPTMHSRTVLRAPRRSRGALPAHSPCRWKAPRTLKTPACAKNPDRTRPFGRRPLPSAGKNYAEGRGRPAQVGAF